MLTCFQGSNTIVDGLIKRHAKSLVFDIQRITPQCTPLHKHPPPLPPPIPARRWQHIGAICIEPRGCHASRLRRRHGLRYRPARVLSLGNSLGSIDNPLDASNLIPITLGPLKNFEAACALCFDERAPVSRKIALADAEEAAIVVVAS